jgi:hypothetical protein
VADYGKFWCDKCQAFFPDPLEDMHREAHALERQRQRGVPFLLIGGALIGVLLLIILIVRP